MASHIKSFMCFLIYYLNELKLKLYSKYFFHSTNPDLQQQKQQNLISETSLKKL